MSAPNKTQGATLWTETRLSDAEGLRSDVLERFAAERSVEAHGRHLRAIS